MRTRPTSFVLGLALLASGLAAADGAPHPSAAVGIVLVDGRGACSGTLVEPDVVITAAHCVERNGARLTPGRLAFRSGAYPGAVAAERPVRRVVFHPLYRDDRPFEMRTAYDLAALRLGDPVPAASARPLPVAKTLSRPDRMLVVSYRSGQGVRGRERMCPVLSASKEVISLGCDLRPGESGAPVLVRDGTGALRVAGVVSARAEFGLQKVGFVAGAARIGQVRAVLGPRLPDP